MPEETQTLDSFIDIDTSNVPDAKVLPEGEVRVRLKACEQKLSSKQNPMIVCQYTIPSEPLVDDLYFYVNLPHAGQEEGAQMKSARAFGKWKDAHGLPQKGGIDLVQLGNSGLELFVFVGIEEYQGEKKNRLQKFIRKA